MSNAAPNAPRHHASPVPCDTCGGGGELVDDSGSYATPDRGNRHRAFPCPRCHGAGFEACEGCSIHLSSHDGRGHYQTHTGAVVCSLRCARLVRMRQARDLRELAAAESAARAGRRAA